RKQAEGFYEVHRGKPFYEGLTEFMSSGPCVVIVLEKEGAVKAWRDLMGATDPAKADEGTIRKEFGGSVGENATHGSDSDENAAIEISYFFSKLELVWKTCILTTEDTEEESTKSDKSLLGSYEFVFSSSLCPLW